MQINCKIWRVGMALALVAQACSSAPKAPAKTAHVDNDLETMGLKGKVKSLVLTENEPGYRMEVKNKVTDTFENNIKLSAHSYVFDSFGYTIQEKEYGAYDKLESGYNCLLGPGHGIIKVMYLSPDHEHDTIVYSYNAASQLLSKSSYIGQELKYYEMYFYSNNNKTRHETYDHDNKLINYDIYKYDDKNNCIEERNCIVSEDSLQESAIYAFDEESRLIYEKHTRPTNYGFTINVSRDGAGKVIRADKTETYANGSKQETYEYSYNNQGYIDKIIILNWWGNPDDEKSKYIFFKYDYAGNWVEKRICRKQHDKYVPMTIETAAIAYY
jgi:hypothetical protein